MSRWRPAAALLALLSGPIAAQPLQQPTPEAAARRLADAARDDAQAVYLLQRVQDLSLPGRGLPLTTFAERVSGAVLSNPATLAARSTIGAAGEAVREAKAGLLPQLSAQIDASARNTDANTVLNSPKLRYETAGAGVSLRQNVFDFGATQAAIEGAREREAATAARVQNREADLALRSIEAWFDVVRARRQRELAALNLQAMRTMLDFLNQRMELGGGPVSDVLRAQTRVTSAVATLATAEARERVNAAAFRELFREEPGALDMPVQVALDPRAVAADMAALVRDFPAVRAAEAVLRAAQQDREQLAARELPFVNLELNAQRRDMIGAGTPGTDLGAVVVMRYNFYTGGADSARTAQAGYRVSEASETLRSVSQQVERALQQALAEEQSAQAVLQARAETVTQSIVALSAVRELFVNRRGSLLDLLNAQETVNLSGQALIDADIEAANARWRVLYFTASFGSVLGLPQTPAAYSAPGSTRSTP